MSTPKRPFALQFAHYMNTAPGIENALRLLQAVCQLVVAWKPVGNKEAWRWKGVGNQFALGRRYFRYFQFITYFGNAWDTLIGQNETINRRGRTAVAIEVCSLSSYGCYLWLEAFTIPDSLGFHSTKWSRMALIEANKFWFYALLFSIIGNIWQLFQLYLEPNERQSRGPTRQPTNKYSKPKSKRSNGSTANGSAKTKPQSQAHKAGYPYSTLVRNLTIHGCDLLIPGTIVGWIEVSPVLVNSAMILSTVLVGRDRWTKTQQNI
uniref:PEX11 domain-containing protein n=1 Tax=Coccidioides posadasii RMSCC 3488 TaxID=454284 RepID=A0A0J6FB59_COCPO|nr:PEX11 domain-containing protein [Coccidioides posadasii RMSCC 3488]